MRSVSGNEGSVTAWKVQCSGEWRFLSQSRSFQQALQLGSRAKSALQGELCLTQLSAAFFLDVQKSRPVGKRKTRVLSLTRDNVPLPPSHKSSNFPTAITSPEPVTPSEMLTCVRISDSNTCQAVSGYQKAEILPETPYFVKDWLQL